MNNPEEFDLKSMEKETERMLRLRYITPENSHFEETEGGFLSLEIEGEFYPRVQTFMCFPFTDSESFISIRTPDEKAEEIGVIRNLKEMDSHTREIIKRQIKYRYFTPVIESIYSVKTEYGFAYFDVKTDSGKCRFVIRMNGGAVVSLTDTRIIIFDLDGNRFEIPDITRLSAKERKMIDLFV